RPLDEPETSTHIFCVPDAESTARLSEGEAGIPVMRMGMEASPSRAMIKTDKKFYELYKSEKGQ
ncbi:MAG: hypothetical protein LBS57_04075, partial [Treponema sp.]|nr:hypothetical protein [Treponema sp.]